jgi:hypothetical protein
VRPGLVVFGLALAAIVLVAIVAIAMLLPVLEEYARHAT